jgi:hypothetical protein
VGNGGWLTVVISAFDRVVWVSALGIQVGEELEGRFAEADQLNSTAIARGGGTASGTGFLARSHLVHPRAAVLAVAAVYKASLAVYAYFVVETLVGHVRVDLAAGVSFAELEALEVNPEGFLHDVLKRLVLRNNNSLAFAFNESKFSYLLWRQLRGRQSRLSGRVERRGPGKCDSRRAPPARSFEWSRATTKLHRGS